MVPNLPKLRKGEQYIKSIGQSGRWHYVGESAELSRLADSLDLAGQERVLAADKVPDVWARLIMLHIALTTGPDHPLYLNIRGAYRGCLAFLALSKRNRWQLQLRDVTIEASPDVKFLDTIHRLRPDLCISTDTDWRRVFLFFLDGLPVAATSPLTLVCPNAGVHLAPALGRVRWWQQGEFRDPVEWLNSTERGLVTHWIQKLHRQVTSHPGADPQLRELVASELKAFAEDLSTTPIQVQYVRDWTIDHGMLQYLAETIPPDAAISSDVEIVPSVERGAVSPSLLVIDSSLGTQWQRSPTEITVFGAITLADIERLRKALGTDPSILGTVSLQSNIWRWSDYFFTPKLLLVDENTDAFPGAVAVNGQQAVAGAHRGTPVLPIKSELFRYLTPNQVVNNCRYTADSRSITVHLTLPLRGGECTVRRTYIDPEIVRLPRIPVVEVWPNFTSPHWRLYFTFWDRVASEQTFYAVPVAPGGIQDRCAELDSRGNREREVCQLTSPPEYFVCRLLGQEREEMGVLVVSLERGQDPTGDTFRIGVDFGTTNTHAYVKRTSRDEPEPLRLSAGTRRISASLDPERIARLYQFFLPTTEAVVEWPSVPFLSFFRSRPGEGSENKAVLSGHILFYRTGSATELRSGNVSAYLKWDKSQLARQRMRTYIEQVCLHAAAECVSQGASALAWAYSYPTAFSLKLIIDMESVWRQACERLQRVTGLDCTVEQSPRPYTESVAVARYFHRRLGATPHPGAVIVDVGGGTSDIAVWQNGSIRWQTSLRIAGQELLLEPLFRLYERIPGGVVTHLFGQGARDRLLPSDRSLFFREMDAILKVRGAQSHGALPDVSEETPIPVLLRHIGIGLAGLFYYVGLLLKHLSTKGLYAPTTPRIYVGGNGSRLFHWIQRGPFEPQSSPLKGFFADMVTVPGGVSSQGFSFELTREPKAEVAYGIVVESPLGVAAGAVDASSVVSGEECTVRDTPVEVLTASDFSTGVNVGQLSNLADFVDLFNRYARGRDWLLLPIAPVTDILRDVQDSTLQSVAERRGQSQEEIELEPIFVMALRALLRKQLEAA